MRVKELDEVIEPGSVPLLALTTGFQFGTDIVNFQMAFRLA
jgi:hypothetical protein